MKKELVVKIHISFYLGTIEPFSIKKEDFKIFETLLNQLVAGVHIERVWKFRNKVRRTSSADVISHIKKKKSFSRHFMEKTLGLTTGQSYWYIRHFLKENIIVKLEETKAYDNVCQLQALYKYAGNQ